MTISTSKSASWREVQEWGKKEKPDKQSSYIFIYLVIIVIAIIIIYCLISYFSSDNKLDILSNLNKPDNALPVQSKVSFQTPIVTPVMKSSGHSRRVPYIVPSPGGTSILSPNARMVPDVHNGREGVWMYKRRQ